jgi:PKD repeat protein
MMTTNATLTGHVLRAAVALSLLAATGCGLEKQEEPALTGPSEYGYSITVQSHTDRLPQDGVSVVRVTARVLDSGGKPVPDFWLLWTVTAPPGVFVEPSDQQTKTNAQGETTITVRAPTPPAFLPGSTAQLTITARPVGSDALSTDNYRTIVVQLIPPAGTLPVNNPPVPAFTISPAIGNINQTMTFDASLTRDEGEPCGSLCSYAWDFGDFETGSGMVVTHAYSRPATFTVTLTVTDSRGGVASSTKELIISGPLAPVARLEITPASAVGGTNIAFNGANSTVGLGATITQYVWDFGDGTSVTTTGPVTSKAYPPVTAGQPDRNYPVVLTVFDNFGRTSVATGTVTATAPEIP